MLKRKSQLRRKKEPAAPRPPTVVNAPRVPPLPPERDYEKALQVDRQHLEGQVRHFEREVRSMRIALAEKEGAVAHYAGREASFVQANESLRARLAAYQGVRELTEATESQNGSLRGQLRDAYESGARVKSDLETTAKLLGQS